MSVKLGLIELNSDDDPKLIDSFLDALEYVVWWLVVLLFVLQQHACVIIQSILHVFFQRTRLTGHVEPAMLTLLTHFVAWAPLSFLYRKWLKNVATSHCWQRRGWNQLSRNLTVSSVPMLRCWNTSYLTRTQLISIEVNAAVVYHWAGA